MAEKVNPIQLQKYLKGVDYPASKQDLVKCARDEGADQHVQDTLNRLPDQKFQTPAEVSQAVGKIK